MDNETPELQIMECTRCGALVLNTKLHDEHHQVGWREELTYNQIDLGIGPKVVDIAIVRQP